MMAFSSNTSFSLFIGFLPFVFIIPTLQAEFKPIDDYWSYRELQAKSKPVDDHGSGRELQAKSKPVDDHGSGRELKDGFKPIDDYWSYRELQAKSKSVDDHGSGRELKDGFKPIDDYWSYRELQAKSKPVDDHGSERELKAEFKPIDDYWSYRELQAKSKPVDDHGSERELKAEFKPIDDYWSYRELQAKSKPVDDHRSERELKAEFKPIDDYWSYRELQAKENINNSYHPNPEKVTKIFNDHVVRTMMGLNETRRNLRGKKGNEPSGPCKATNPIDQCWRCDPNWETNRQKMADCALGFGNGTIGGKNGEIYMVTSDLDDPLNPQPGMLRHAVIQKTPLWIIFKQNYDIKLKEELIMQSDKTIDGRGANVHIAGGAGITIQFTKNIIITNIHIHNIKVCNGGNIRDSVDHMGFRTKSDGHGVSLFGATNVWLDHLSMYRCGYGIIEAIQGSTAVTISNCHFTDHNDVMLFGSSDDCDLDKKMQITLAFNHFGKGLGQMMPRVRTGFFHVVNNDYTHWIKYAIAGSNDPTIISQGNRFSPTTIFANKEVTKRDCTNDDWKKWSWISEDDVFENGAFFTPSGIPKASKKFGAIQMASFKLGQMVHMLTKDSGTIICEPGKDC